MAEGRAAGAARGLTDLTRKPICIAGAVRSPIGKFGGGLAALSAPALAGPVAKEALRRAGVPAEAVSTVIFGHGRQAGAGPNPSRQVGQRAGVPYEAPAYTVNQACASGLRALVNGAQEILLGETEVVLAGGMESMSNTPYMHLGQREDPLRVADRVAGDGLEHAGAVQGSVATATTDVAAGALVTRATASRLLHRRERVARRAPVTAGATTLLAECRAGVGVPAREG